MCYGGLRLFWQPNRCAIILCFNFHLLQFCFSYLNVPPFCPYKTSIAPAETSNKGNEKIAATQIIITDNMADK